MPTTPYNNKNLFSNRYLESLIAKTPEWDLVEHEKAFDEIKEIFENNKTKVRDISEAQLEDIFLRKVFDVINPHYIVQAKTETQEFPDYAFYLDGESRDRAYQKDASKFTECIVVGEAKKWIVELGARETEKKEKYGDPSFQLWMYLQKTEKNWGFLTNGRIWRIFRKDKLFDVFYEINLEEILNNNDKDAFRYFYYFFRREAFTPIDGKEIFVERVFKSSVDYAKELGDDLKDKVYQAMKILADGFIENPANKLDKSKPEDLAMVQHSTMRLLYRMLFLLYAEGKGLLDLSNPAYKNDYSFWRLKNSIKEDPSSVKMLWGDLAWLFNLINYGSEGCNIPKNKVFIPPYNGGLFSPEKNRNLAEWDMADEKLSEAIALLAIEKPNGSGGFIDYSTLDIRHLGSIYEGLLEFKLKVADKEMVASGGKAKTWMPLEEHNQGKKKKALFTDFDKFDRVRADEIYLATDKGERKASGSYYTPDYIVEYIVKNTVGPIVEEKWKEAEKKRFSLVEATLTINVLDPAMGSGHFLVGATDFLAAKLIEALEKDVLAELMPDDKSYDIHWAKREVVSHCIYGVDLNEMAVELAKLSLWLTTISKDKPLSFLDHRLKHGNSLIGAGMADLPWHPKKKRDKAQRKVDIPEGFIKKFVETIDKLDSIDDDSLDNIKQKEKIFQNLKSTIEYDKIETLADMRTSIYFGNEVEEKKYGDITARAYYDSEAQWSTVKNSEFGREAMEIAKAKTFFHWELEFPEVFFEDGKVKKNPGFDAVVGNPPYVREEAISIYSNYFKINYQTIFDGKADIYVYFVGKSLNLTNQSGVYGIIVSNKWLRSKYGMKLRNFVKNNTRILKMLDFGELPVFEDAGTFPHIVILDYQKHKNHGSFIQIKKLPVDQELNSVIKQDDKVTILPAHLESYSWAFEKHNTLDIKKKVLKVSQKLSEYTGKPFLVGIKTGRNSAYIMDKNKMDEITKGVEEEKKLFKKFLIGDDIQRYYVKHEERFLLYPYNDLDSELPLINLDEFPNVKEYLLSIKHDLSCRAIIKDKLAGNPDIWYSLQQINKNIDIRRPKIIYPDIGKELRFTIDYENHYIDMTGFIIESGDKYLLSILNSIFTKFQLNTICSTLGDAEEGGRLRYKSQYMEQLLIRRISFTTPAPLRKELAANGQALYDEFTRNGSEATLDFVEDCLPKDKDGNFITEKEKSDVVHDILAFLAERMIEMNKEKQAEINGFLGWLEGYIGVKIDDLQLKTKLTGYNEADWSEFKAALDKNKKSITGKDITRREHQEKLKAEFEESTGKLGPLMARIEKTDGVIDRVVYKLYGLTEEEVRVVEGKE